MTRVASFSQNQGLLTGMLRNQADLFKAQQQVTTGKKSQDYKGIASDTSTLVSARSLKSQADSFVRSGERVSQTLSTNDLQLSTIVDTARDIQAAITQALASDDATGLRETIDQSFLLLSSTLNTQIGGSYVFGGSRVRTVPFTPQSLQELAALPSAADAFANDQLRATARIADNMELSYGVLADEVGADIMNWLRDFALFDASPSGDLGGQLLPDQRTYLTSQLRGLDDAIQTVQSVQVSNGLKQAQVEDLGVRMTERGVFLENFIAELEDVNMAEAISRLQNEQTALEASYRSFATLSDLSLTRFI